MSFAACTLYDRMYLNGMRRHSTLAVVCGAYLILYTAVYRM